MRNGTPTYGTPKQNEDNYERKITTHKKEN